MAFEALTINNELTTDETTAIEGLKIDATNTKEALKTALNTEKLTGVTQSLSDVAAAFVTYNVKWDATTSTLTCDAKGTDNADTPAWLKTLISDADTNDFAYLLYKASSLLGVDTSKIEQQKLTEATITQLASLKAEILKVDQPEVKDDKAPVSNEVPATTEVNASFLKYGVTAQQIVDAITTLKTSKPTLAAEIVPLLKSGSVSDVQSKLKMLLPTDKGYATAQLYEKADGLFGPRSLANLKAGEVVEYKEVAAQNPVKDADDKDTDDKDVDDKDDKKKEVNEVAAYIDKQHVLYQADYETQQKIIKEVQAYLLEKYPDRSTEADFYTNLATGIMEHKESFVYDGATYYFTDGDTGIEVFTTKTAYDAKKKEIADLEAKAAETAKRVEARKKSAAYAEKIFPATLKITGTMGKYKIKNDISIPMIDNFPSALGELTFSSKKNAEDFITLTKKFITTYGFILGKKSVIWEPSLKGPYLISAMKLLDTGKTTVVPAAETATSTTTTTGMVGKKAYDVGGLVESNASKITKLSTVIDTLGCFTA